jgi:hypothetical protein
MSAKPGFKEVIRPPLWLIAFLYFMLYSLVLAIWAAFDDAIALNAFAIATVLGFVVIRFATVTIIVGDELRIGRAHIPVHFLGESEIVKKSDFVRARTRDADPAAYFALTFWVSQGLKVKVIDEQDPTPYWLISTRRAEALQKALQS